MTNPGYLEYIRQGAEAHASFWYNGFTPGDRRGTNPAQRVERYGKGNNPLTCCITGYSRPDDPKGAGYMYGHLEDYRRPIDWYSVSKKAHAILHKRFCDPYAWFDLVAANYVHGAWFTFLLMSPKKMYMPFDVIYPEGLPPHGELWPDVADAWGISKAFYQSDDTLAQIRTLWSWGVQPVA